MHIRAGELKNLKESYITFLEKIDDAILSAL